MTRGLPEETKQLIISLRRQGYTWSQISWKLKVTKGQVAGVLHRAGMSKPKGAQHAQPDRRQG